MSPSWREEAGPMLDTTTPYLEGKKIIKSHVGGNRNYETIPLGKGNMLRISASGTAVVHESE